MYRTCVLDLFNVIWKDRTPFWDVSGLIRLFRWYFDFMKKKNCETKKKNKIKQSESKSIY